MYFAEQEQERYSNLVISEAGKRLFPNGSKVAGVFHQKTVSHRIDSRYANENLEPGIRDSALKYLSEISSENPHAQKKKRYVVPNNLCDSNVSYLNFWFAFNNYPEKLKKLLISLGYDVAELIDIREDRPYTKADKPIYIGFEYGGKKDYLRPHQIEFNGDKRSYSTISDFYFRFRRTDGKIQTVIGEWKYTEDHRYSARKLKPTLKGKIEEYTSLFKNLNLPRNFDHYELAYDPFRQIARLQLLAYEMEKAREDHADEVSLLLVTPKANKNFNFDIISKQLGTLGTSVFEIWEKVAPKNRFKGVYLEDLFKLITTNECYPDHNWLNYQNDRYNLSELAKSQVPTTIVESGKMHDTVISSPKRYAVIADKYEVEQLQIELRDKFLENSDEKDLVGKLPITKWSVCQLNIEDGTDIWYLYNLHTDMPGSRKDRYWNILGSGKYTHWRHAELELNIPMESDKSMQAAFVEDDLGKRYLVHRGGFRGKKRMMTRSFFIERFNGKLIAAGEGRRLQNFAVIACLDDQGDKFISDVAAFLSEVKRIKNEFNSMIQ